MDDVFVQSVNNVRSWNSLIIPDSIKILGRLYFRASYGQALNHSIEVAKLAGVMRGELGEDANLAGFHDIGKALDHEIEGVLTLRIGAEIAQKYKKIRLL